MALLLPAVQAAREAARSAQCKSSIRQVGLALHNYHDIHGRLPPGWIANQPEGTPGWGWTVSILPQLEQQPLHATLLVDGQGFVRWQDVSYEPFTDTSFLLVEAQRLLRVHPSGLPEGAPVGPRPISAPP